MQHLSHVLAPRRLKRTLYELWIDKSQPVDHSDMMVQHL
uniref:Uncharacterized protein n=1 Tax=Rhizobium rhizogenes TaxID=359 RepID=A0A7S5DSV0_RHIRH|nr:hypothetical protein pC5.8d_709 [Rhizobium rhizogenes]